MKEPRNIPPPDTEKTKAMVFNCYVGGLAVIRSLGRRGIPVVAVDYSRDAIGFSSRYTYESVIAPHPETDEDGFVEFLIEGASKWAGSILIPAHDFELAAFSHYKEELSRHYILPVPAWKDTKNIVDKKGTYEIAARLGIPIPKTLPINSISPMEVLKDSIDYPCLLKPRKGYEFLPKAKRKSFIINDSEQLKSGIAQADQFDCEMMIQELIPGGDDQFYEYIAYYNQESKPMAEFTWRKLRQNPPVLGVGRVGESTHSDEIIGPSRQILDELLFVGLCEVEFKKDPRDGQLKLVEINGRNTLQMALPIRCGIDFPWIMYNDLVWKKKLQFSEYQAGVKWINELADIPYAIRHPIREKPMTKKYLSPYFSQKTFAIFAKDDWKPAFIAWYLGMKHRFISISRIPARLLFLFMKGRHRVS
jgi:D-aspartate ligase